MENGDNGSAGEHPLPRTGQVNYGHGRDWTLVVGKMSVLELEGKKTDLLRVVSDGDGKNTKDSANTTESTQDPVSLSPLLSSGPPRIGKVEKSKVLERAAAFLPQLATANRKLSTLSPEAVNIESLTGGEERVIEMKLGLGVFEEQNPKPSQPSHNNNIAILPSELTQCRERQSDSDRLDAFIQQLLAFNGSDEDEPVEIYTNSDDSSSDCEILEFE